MSALPEYDAQLSLFHAACERELDAIVNALPLTSEMRVLDLACGDGFYTLRIAERLGAGGSELRELVDPKSPGHLLRQEHVTMTWLNVLALGRKV